MFLVSRFKDIERREFIVEVVTPLFLGGADPKKAELRAPPIKAALRFWWRALNGGSNVKEIAQKETGIFGSTEKKAVVSVKIDAQNVKPVPDDLPYGKKIMVTSSKATFPISIIEYLAFGLFNPKLRTGKYIREHFAPGIRFKIILDFPKNLEVDAIEPLKAMIAYGGLGARSRNGFGSLHCDAAKVESIQKQGNLKSFTAFSSEAILFNQFQEHKTWFDALSEIGEIYRQARLSLEERHKWRKRALIAMPIEARNEDIPNEIRTGRHAKPYFLHVGKTTTGKYRGQILFLPYLYKPRPEDKEDRLSAYKEACKKMNEEINKGMGGAK